jgi:HPt (histidine-containing phosphotransfer) domain-containing protein
VLGAAARMVDTLPSAPIGIAPANDVAAMDVAQGLKIWVDQASYQEYLHRFVDLYSHAVGDIKQSLVHGYRPTAVALAHKLSGVAANLALPEVRRLAALAERVMNMDQDPTVELRQLDAAMESALAEIAHFLHQVNS